MDEGKEIATHTYIHLGLLDRLRCLFHGTIIVHTDTVVVNEDDMASKSKVIVPRVFRRRTGGAYEAAP